MGILARGGYELTPRADEAEVLVVNTCSFIEAAQKESVDAILEMAEHKKFGAAKKLIVAGCLVERYRAQILEQVPEVDAIVGTGEVERILEAVEGDLRMLPAAAPAFLYHDLTPARGHHSAPRRVHKNCRRLRPSLYFLHHSAVARQISQPPIRIGSARSAKPRRSRRARNHLDWSGHHFLRRRPRLARWPRATPRPPRAGRRFAVGALSLRLPQSRHAKTCSTRWLRIRASHATWTCPCSTPAATCWPA